MEKSKRTVALEIQGAKNVIKRHNKRREAALLAAEKERVQQEIRDKAAQL